MGTFQDIDVLVGHLAWPAVALAGMWMFRWPIRGFLDELESVTIGKVSARRVRRELDRGEQALALAEAEVITTVGSDLQLQWRTLQSEREPATLAGSPTVRILVAWSQVEDALQKAQDYRARPDTDRPRAAVTYGNVKGIPGLLHHWIVADLTPASTVQVYRALATVRNALANGGSTGHPTEETARDYEEQATRLRNLILLADRREYPRPAEP